MKKLLPLLVFALSLAASAGLLSLSACADDPPPAVKYSEEPSAPIKLDVLNVVVIDRSPPLLGNTPYTNNNFEPTVANAMRHWATDKLVAVGTSGEAIVVIRDADLRFDQIHHPDSWFTREQAGKYTAHAEIELDISGREGHGLVTAEATRFETLPETPSAFERQNAYYKTLNGLMLDLGANLRQEIGAHLTQFVITAPTQPR